MAEVAVPRNAGSFPGEVYVAEGTLTVAAAETTATWTSKTAYSGEVVRVEIDPGAALTASATLKGYEAGTALATGTRMHFLNYTVPNPAVERQFVPLVAATTNAGVAVTYALDMPIYVPIAVSGKLKVDLASATAADSVTVRIYVKA